MRTANLFLLGKGGVGSAFFRLLPAVLEKINCRFIGVADRKHIIIDPESLYKEYAAALDARDLSCHRSSLAHPGLPELAHRLLSFRKENLVVIDATSGETGSFWSKLLTDGAGVITANKKPLAGYYEEFLKWSKFSSRFRYEATVGGGLPIISTIMRLLKSGDEIVDIRGLMSGTLSYIMNEVSTGKSFSEAVREAHALGYTEPDPRDDLSGADIGRKALILARTLGAKLEPEHIQVESLVPAGIESVSVDEFLEKLSSQNHLYKRSEKIGYVATVTPTGARIGLESLSAGDPLSALTGPENMVVIRTKRYFRNPLVIRGPGAGAEVTATGVMGDVLRVLDVL